MATQLVLSSQKGNYGPELFRNSLDGSSLHLKNPDGYVWWVFMGPYGSSQVLMGPYSSNQYVDLKLIIVPDLIISLFFVMGAIDLIWVPLHS